MVSPDDRIRNEDEKMHDVQTILGLCGVQPGEAAVIHMREPVCFTDAPAKITSTVVAGDEVLERVSNAIADHMEITITPIRPISDLQAGLERDRLTAWIAQADASAKEEGGSGILLGHDQLAPERRIAADAFDVAQDEVVADGSQLFRWADVGSFTTSEGGLTATAWLIDGRTVFLHADVDWHNLLS
jgi:hypothetical protein